MNERRVNITIRQRNFKLNEGVVLDLLHQILDSKDEGFCSHEEEVQEYTCRADLLEI